MDSALEKPRFDHKVIRPNGPWVPSSETDVTKTWARARARQQDPAQAEADDAPLPDPPTAFT